MHYNFLYGKHMVCSHQFIVVTIGTLYNVDDLFYNNFVHLFECYLYKVCGFVIFFRAETNSLFLFVFMIAVELLLI